MDDKGGGCRGVCWVEGVSVVNVGGSGECSGGVVLCNRRVGGCLDLVMGGG